MTAAEAVVRRHVDAFNAADLDALLACFAAEATWVTGTDGFRGRDELRGLFAGAFAALRPRLHVDALLVDGDRVACELREDLDARTDHIAGFYRVEAGLIVAAKIYREGSASI